MAYYGVAFRQSGPYVTDGANDTFSLGEAFPIARAPFEELGWNANSSADTRNRSNAVDPRLAGVIFALNSGPLKTFTLKLKDGPGTYRVRSAIGDFGSAQNNRVVFKDGSTVRHTVEVATFGGRFTDTTAQGSGANGGITDTGWVSANQVLEMTFDTGYLTVEIGGHPSGALSSALAYVATEKVGASPATGITLSGPATGNVGAPSTNFTVGANGTLAGSVTVTPSDGGGGGTFTPASVAISPGTPTATFTYTPGSAGAKAISVTNSGGLTNPGALTYTATVPAATTLALSVPDAAGLSGFSGVVLSAAAPGAGVTVLRTITGLSFNGSGQANIDITGLGVPAGAYRWVSVTNSNGTPGQSPAPVQAQGPVLAS